jgi:signal transduction histidine kinase
MLRIAYCLMFLAVLFVALSCGRNWDTEKEEVAYWRKHVADTAFRKLYQDGNLPAALALYDSLLEQTGKTSPYSKATRFDLQSNYYYFFTPNNEATAALIDSALAQFNTPALQRQYPRAYVGFLLFGGQLAYRLHRYNKANHYFFRAKKLADAHLDPCERKSFNYSIAMVLYRQQNFLQSLHYFKEAFDLQNTCVPQTAAIILQQQEIQSNIGLCLVHLKQYDSALVYFDSALRIAVRHADSLGPVAMDKIRGVINGNKAQVFLAQNKLEAARQASLTSIALNGRPGYEVENAQAVKLQLAEVYGRQKAFDSMFEVLRNLRTELDTLANPQVELGWRHLMSDYYERTGRPQLGLPYFKSYALLHDSLDEYQKELTAADVNRQLEEKEKELQIAVLKKDNQLAVVSLWVTIVFALLVIVIGLLVGLNYRQKKLGLAKSLALYKEIDRQKAAREEEAARRHKEITEAVIQAQEAERSLIGLELHDNINQVLTTVKLHHEMVVEGLGDAHVLLPRASNYLQQCINEIRSISKRLSAPTLGKISLQESVKDLLDSVDVMNKVKITRKISGLPSLPLKQEVHLGMYRILQEQINNVLKHSEATEVVVGLEADAQNIRLYIEDNGKGFAATGKAGGIGLMNMRTRAEYLNGSFELESKPGAGCRVHVVVPVAGDA